MAARSRSLLAISVLSLMLCTFLGLGCSDDDGGTTPQDTTPPSAITDLAVQTTATTSVTVRWTAPGDDGTTGQATSYDLRYMIGDASTFAWSSATQVTGLPAPQAAGTNQSHVVQGLTNGTTYTFAIKTADEGPNWSGISNLVSAQPGGGVTGCQVSPTNLDFGSVTVGGTSDRTFTITNTGTQALSGTVSEACDPFSIVSGGGAYTLAASEVRTVTIQYAPTSAGSHTCTIDTGPAACSDVTCAGSATGSSGGCQVSPATLMFALTSVNSFRVMEFYISNNGSSTISGTVSQGDGPFEVMTGAGAYTLAQGQWRLVIVRFAPSAEGNYSGTIDTGLEGCADVSCSGPAGNSLRDAR